MSEVTKFQPVLETGNWIYRTSPVLTNDELNGLMRAARPDHKWRDYQPILRHSLAYICAYMGKQIIGFVNLAWDGGEHAFILDTLVHPDFRRRGIGQEIVRRAVSEAGNRGLKWVHVDFEPRLQRFYDGCGFRHTSAGLVRLEKRL